MLSVEEGENIDSVARRSRDFNRFADCLPGLRHTRIEREAGFIAVIKINLASVSHCLKSPQFGLRGLKVRFITFIACATSEALPGFTALLEDAFERVKANLFACLFFNLREASFGGARVFLDNFDRLPLFLFIKSRLATTSFLILKAFDAFVLPAIEPVADRIAIYLIDICDLVYAIPASAEQDGVSAPPCLLITGFHRLA